MGDLYSTITQSTAANGNTEVDPGEKQLRRRRLSNGHITITLEFPIEEYDRFKMLTDAITTASGEPKTIENISCEAIRIHYNNMWDRVVGSLKIGGKK